MKKQPLAGKYGRLEILREVAPCGTGRHAQRMVECRCACGKTVVVRSSSLKNGHTVSCGCAKDNNWHPLGPTLSGMFHRLTIERETDPIVSPSGYSTRAYRCRCACGSVVTVSGAMLKSGHTKSCGCLRKESARTRFTTHGLTGTPEHYVWASMRQRCADPKHKSWPDYGGRGIEVCPRWSKFENFLADMGPRPSPAHTIERNNTDGPYDPGNCRWATRTEQMNNTRANRRLEFRGRVQNVSQWAVELGIKAATLRRRIFVCGWSIERAFTEAVH